MAKTFFTLKNYCRTVKLVENLRKSILKLILRRLFFQTHQEERKEVLVEKFLERKRKFKLFQAFLVLKEKTTINSYYESRICNFQEKKNL